MWGRRYWGITAAALVVGDVRLPFWAGDPRGQEWNMKKRTPKGEGSPDREHVAAVDSTLMSGAHALVKHCAVTRYDDGTARTPGWFTVKTMGSAWVVECKDPDSGCRLVVVQQTLDEAVMLAGLLLDSDEAPWEPDPWLSAAKARKKK